MLDDVHVSNGIHDVEEENRYLFGIIAGNIFSSYVVLPTTPLPARLKF